MARAGSLAGAVPPGPGGRGEPRDRGGDEINIRLDVTLLSPESGKTCKLAK